MKLLLYFGEVKCTIFSKKKWKKPTDNNFITSLLHQKWCGNVSSFDTWKNNDGNCTQRRNVHVRPELIETRL